jgi:hypothetical protein
MTAPRKLVRFLLARISEEETAALDSRSWYHGGGERPSVKVEPTPESFAAFVIAHDPDRVLTDCVAKRRIIKVLTSPRWAGPAEQRDLILRLLALPYAGHPEFFDEWSTDPREAI